MKKNYILSLFVLFFIPVMSFTQGIEVVEVNKTVGTGENYELSVRNDGTVDLIFKVQRNSKGNRIVIVNESAKTEVAASDMPHFNLHGNYATAFEYGEDMGEDWVLDDENTITLAQNYGDHEDDFKGTGKRFIGIKQKMAGSTMYHYGWIEVNVSEDASSITFVEYGFNTAHNDRVLFAGEKDIIDGITNEENFESNFEVNFQDNTLNVNSDLVHANYELYDLAGSLKNKAVLKFGSNSFPTSNLTKGIYLIHINARNKRVVKKVFLN